MTTYYIDARDSYLDGYQVITPFPFDFEVQPGDKILFERGVITWEGTPIKDVVLVKPWISDWAE